MIVDLSTRRLGNLGAPALSTILPPQWPITGDPAYNIQYINNWYQQAIPHLNAWATDFFAALRGMGFTIQMITTPETWYASPTSWAYEFNVIKDGFTYRANLQPVNAMQNSSDAFAQYIAQKWAQEKSIAQAAASTPSVTQTSTPQTQIQTSTPTTQTSTPQTTTSTQTSTTTQNSSASTPQTTTSYVRSANIQMPQGAVVGAPWTITVMGAPNQPVSVAAWQDGKSLGETTYGQTDANGRFTKSGTFTAETVGVWVETWKVAGTPVGTITFTVMPEALTTAQPTSSSSSQSPSPAIVSVGTPTGADTPHTDQTATKPAVGMPDVPPWYERIPIWAWALAGAGALFFMRDRR